jgi:hypothetical protein
MYQLWQPCGGGEKYDSVYHRPHCMSFLRTNAEKIAILLKAAIVDLQSACKCDCPDDFS